MTSVKPESFGSTDDDLTSPSGSSEESTIGQPNGNFNQTEIQALATERDGYKGAYEQLSSEVGNLRSERDGYKGAYSQISSEFGNVVSERDGFKNAYEEFSSQIGALRSEREGFKKAYDQISSEIGNLRSERDGYKGAYDQISSEIGSLRSERDGFERAYDQLSSEIGALRSERHGYIDAYDRISAEIGTVRSEREGFKTAYESVVPRFHYLREVAAPVIRETVDQRLLGKPSIFLSTLPKSGTVFISHALKLTLGYDFTGVMVTPTFPKNIVWETMAEDFARGGLVSASHMEPDRENIDVLLRHGIVKGVVHIRDPRAALVSWLHFRLNYGASASGLEKISRAAPVHSLEFRSLAKEQQIDFYIDTFYKHCVNWIVGWLDVVEVDRQLDYLLTTHESLMGTEVVFIQKILNYFEIDAEPMIVEKSKENHFRSGDNVSWRADMSESQVERVNNLIPQRLWERFGWVR